MEASAGIRYSARARAADQGDILGIWQTLEKALAQAPDFYPKPELPYALQYIMDLIAQGLVFVAVNRDDEVVGTVVLDWAHWPWNRGARFLVNQHFWVEPLWRSGGTAIKLLSMAKRRAQALGQDLMLETSMLDADTGKKERFIEKNGFTTIGGKFFLSANQPK